jgi:cyclic nucleotide gated channel alpha 3
LCFSPSYDLFRRGTGAIFFDYAFDCFYLFTFIWELKDARIPRVADISRSTSSYPGDGDIPGIFENDHEGNGENSSNSVLAIQKKRKRLSWGHILTEVVACIPWELFGYASGTSSYYSLRIIKLIRMKNYFKYWNDLCAIEVSSMISFVKNPVLNRVALLVITMAIVGHTTAGLFFYFSWQQVKSGNMASWVYVDELVNVKGELKQSVALCYLHALYWSVQTLATVGFGDIVAYSEGETWFCIFYFYISAFLIYYSIANLMTIITDLDASRTRSIVLKAKFTKYAAYRKLPTKLTQRVFSYYDYQWRQLKGLNEATVSISLFPIVNISLNVSLFFLPFSQLMSELPANFAQSIHQHITRDFLMQLELFRGMNKSFMNVLGENSENYVYSPEDLIIDENSRVSGIYVVLSGQVESMWPGLGEAEILGVKDSFGVAALQKSFVSGRIYRSRAYSEVIFLRGSVFRIVCEKLLNPMEHLDMQRRIADCSSQPAPAVRKTVVLHRFNPKNPESSTINDYQMSDQEKLNMLIRKINLIFFHPDSTFRRIWSSCGFLFQLFYLTSTALLLAMNLHQDFHSHSLSLLISNYIVDIYFLIDFIFRACCFGYELEDGSVILKKKEIFQRYLEKENILVGIIASFPFDLILGASVDWRIIPVLRLLKLLHLQYFYSNADDFVHALSLYCGIAISFEMQRFVTLYIMLFQLCHWVGCVWQLAANISTAVFGYRMSWVILDRLKVLSEVNYDSMPAVAYMRSIYWAINVMSSIGFPDIGITNPVEIVVSIIVMFFGYLIFNTLLGAIATLIGSFNRDKREFNNLVEKMRALGEQAALTEELESKIVRYYEYIWAHHQGINENELLKTLPKSLKSVVVNHVVGPFVTSIPFFANCSEQMQHLIIGMFDVAVFLDGDTLMVQGEVGKEMFIIERGEVEVTNRDRSLVFARLGAGSYIGESCILEIAPRSASVFAVGYVDTFFLTLDNFLKV